MTFFDWESRPAVVDGKSAWFVPSPGAAWAPASRIEVLDSGVKLTPDAFAEAFPDAGLPPSKSDVSLPSSGNQA